MFFGKRNPRNIIEKNIRIFKYFFSLNGCNDHSLAKKNFFVFLYARRSVIRFAAIFSVTAITKTVTNARKRTSGLPPL